MPELSTTKVCSKCGIEKSVAQFGLRSNRKSGRTSWCNECRRLRAAAYRRSNPGAVRRIRQAYKNTVAGFTTRSWGSLNARTINGSRPNWEERSCRYYLRQGVRLEMTREELCAFITANWSIVQEMLAAGQRPSVDRINSEGPYSPDNIQMIPLADNCRKSMAETHAKVRRKRRVSQK
jgi:hypothetical protein